MSRECASHNFLQSPGEGSRKWGYRWRAALSCRLTMRRIGLLLITAGAARVAQRVYTRPLDISGTWHLPEVIRVVKERDDVAYPAHVLLATVLEAMHVAPAAVGLQW